MDSADISGLSQFRIERGTEDNLDALLDLIKALARFEKLSGEVAATRERLRESLFGEPPAAEVLMAHAGEEPAGFALFFQTYSTFLARPGLWLEDLFVVEKWRGRGLGRQLLARVAQVAVTRNYGRMEWSVLDWNAGAVRLYKRLGARNMNEWTQYRLTGEALRELAREPLNSL